MDTDTPRSPTLIPEAERRLADGLGWLGIDPEIREVADLVLLVDLIAHAIAREIV